MSEIIKINILKNNNSVNIYVFIGKIYNGKNFDDIKELFKTNPSDNFFKEIFTENELENIKTNSINVIFINRLIHLDDTIQDMKDKIILALESSISSDEIYLFSTYNNENNNPEYVYKNLTHNNTIDLTQDRFVQFLLNIGFTDIDKVDQKDIYDYNDLINIDLDKYTTIEKSLIEKFIIKNNLYHFIANPFNLYLTDEFLNTNAENIRTTLNSTLLLSHGKIKNNTIYVCLAEDVLTYAKSVKLNEEYFINIYYPFLHNKSILSLDSLISNKTILLESNKIQITDYVINKFDSMDLITNIHFNENNLNYIKNGIKYIKGTIHPLTTFKQSLDIVFKLIHANKERPLIKYNPGKRQENIYRLYANNVASSGKKIPYLSKSNIFKVMKNIGKTTSVSVLNIYNEQTIICEFENNGNITFELEAENDKYYSIEDINESIKKAINPVITIIKNFFEQNGYEIMLFESLYKDNIEINSISYGSVLEISKKINLLNYFDCTSHIFNIIQSELNSKNGIVLKYKRVANYNKMDAIEAFIVEQKNLNTPTNTIIQLMISNFQLSEKDAQKKIVEFLSSLQVERGLYENKKLKIKNNPGFTTTIVQSKFSNNISVDVTSINNINYLSQIIILMQY